MPSGLVPRDRALLVASLLYIGLLALACLVPNAGALLACHTVWLQLVVDAICCLWCAAAAPGSAAARPTCTATTHARLPLPGIHTGVRLIVALSSALTVLYTPVLKKQVSAVWLSVGRPLLHLVACIVSTGPCPKATLQPVHAWKTTEPGALSSP